MFVSVRVCVRMYVKLRLEPASHEPMQTFLARAEPDSARATLGSALLELEIESARLEPGSA